MIVDVVLPSVGQVGRHAAGADEVVVHALAGRLLEEGQDHLALAEPVDHHGRGAEVHTVGGHPDQVRRHTVELGHEHADPYGARRELDAEQRLGGHGEHQLVGDGRQVVHPGRIGGSRDVGELLARLLHAGVQVADDRLGAQHRLAVELEHQAQHPVGGGVLGTHVDDHRLVVAPLDVDVARVDVATLGQAQHGAHLLAQLARRGGPPRQQLLGALGGLGLEPAVLLGLTVRLLRRLEAELDVLGLGVETAGVAELFVHDVVVVVVGHRGPGASLNWTGTRPTP